MTASRPCRPAPASDGEPVLHAYLTAAGGVITPERAHAACMAALPGDRSPRQPGGIRYTAMAPGRYVICARPPADLADLAAWQCQPALAEGTGRRVASP